MTSLWNRSWKSSESTSTAQLTPLMMAACLGKEEVIDAFLKENPHAADGFDGVGSSVLNYTTPVPTHSLLEKLLKSSTSKKPFYSISTTLSGQPQKDWAAQNRHIDQNLNDLKQHPLLLNDIDRTNTWILYNSNQQQKVVPFFDKENGNPDRDLAKLMQFRELEAFEGLLTGLQAKDKKRLLLRIWYAGVQQAAALSSIQGQFTDEKGKEDPNKKLQPPNQGGITWNEIDFERKKIIRFFQVDSMDQDQDPPQHHLSILGRLTYDFSEFKKTLEDLEHPITGTLDFFQIGKHDNIADQKLIKKFYSQQPSTEVR